MKKINKYIGRLIILSLMASLASCVNFKPGWAAFNEKNNSENVAELLAEAYEIESTAGTAERLQLLIDAFKKVEQADPNNYEALWNIGNYNILMGAAYANKVKDKKTYYREAIKYCEKAMSVNEDFSNELNNVDEVPNAFDKLSINEVDAMGNWYTARFYYFKECLKPLGRLMNTDIIIENNAMIQRIDELDSTWFGGANYFSRALYYIAVPAKFGGSKPLAANEFLKAIEIGPNYLIHRWGRAKYLYDLTGEMAEFESDLQWVIAQNPSK